MGLTLTDCSKNIPIVNVVLNLSAHFTRKLLLVFDLFQGFSQV